MKGRMKEGIRVYSCLERWRGGRGERRRNERPRRTALQIGESNWSAVLKTPGNLYHNF